MRLRERLLPVLALGQLLSDVHFLAGVFAALVLRGAFGSSALRRRPGRLPATA